jgi:hypothetical protein
MAAQQPVSCDLPQFAADDGKPNKDFISKATVEVKAKSTACLAPLRSRLEDIRQEIGAMNRRLKTQKFDPYADQKEAEGALGDFQAQESFVVRAISEQDAFALNLDLYAAAVFSNLYRDPTKSQGYFSTSRPFLLLEIRKLVGQEPFGPFKDFSLWGELQLQTASFQSVDNPTLQPIDSFTAEMGFETKLASLAAKTAALNVVFGLGSAGFSAADPGPGLAPHEPDSFGWRGRLGLRLREVQTIWEGTFSELSVFHDPTFIQDWRILVRGRVVVSGAGSGLGAFIEGSLNSGLNSSNKRDEIRLVVGIRLDTLAVLRAVVGAGPH